MSAPLLLSDKSNPFVYGSTVGKGEPAVVRFVGRGLLGRPTDTSITVNCIALEELEVFFEYGTEPKNYTGQTDKEIFPKDVPIEMVMSGLKPNTEYYYRMRYSKPGENLFVEGEEYSFHTQRAPNNSFRFTVTSDSHFGFKDMCDDELYGMTLSKALKDKPDFHIDIGDTFMSYKLYEKGTASPQTVDEQHIKHRPSFGLLSHSVPLFLCIGNHEAERSWLLDGTSENVAVWATNSRKKYYPNPVPDNFYSGNTQEEDFVGLRENYYAWEWGDALFVVLDVHWYEKEKGTKWDQWSLGEMQYKWFKQTLEQSTNKFKFVFGHHVVGVCRGAVEQAHKCEWGDDQDFEANRPGWGGIPIHQLLVENKVNIFFQGHDHFYVRQELDGLVYQEVQQPGDPTYSSCIYDGYCYNDFEKEHGYKSGDIYDGTGHLRVTVEESEATVDFIKSYLPKDQDADHVDGAVAFSYTVKANNTGIKKHNVSYNSDEFYLKQTPQTSFNSSQKIHFHVPRTSKVDIRIRNTRGQEIRTLADKVFSPGSHAITWDRLDNSGHSVAPGVYICSLQAMKNVSKSTKILLK